MSPDLKILQLYAQTRDPSAFSTLVTTYGDMVYATCLRILKNVAEAEDASQECFLRLAKDANKVHSSIAAWLHRCATNECITRIRQSTATTKRELAYEVNRREEGRRPSSTWPEISDQVDQALEELPEELRHIIVGHFLQRKSQTELAAEMGVSSATMSRRISEGVVAIRNKLSRTGFIISALAMGVILIEQTAHAAPTALVEGLGKMAIVGPPSTPLTPWYIVKLHTKKILLSKTFLQIAAASALTAATMYFIMSHAQKTHAPAPTPKPAPTTSLYPSATK